jgi:hypothetical protein
MLSLAARLGVAMYVVSTTLETYNRLKGQYGLGGPSRRRFRICGRVLAPHMPVGCVFGSPVAWVLGNELVTLGNPVSPVFIYTIYIFIWPVTVDERSKA